MITISGIADHDPGTSDHNQRNTHLARPASLAGWAVADIMKLRAFGVQSLVDLLASLEDVTELPNTIEGGRPKVTPIGDGGIEGRDASVEGRRSLLGGIPQWLDWSDLDISVRTFNALVVRRRMSRPAALNAMSLGELMRTKNFGKKSLRDLLIALESATGRSCIGSGSATEPLTTGRHSEPGWSPSDEPQNKEARSACLQLAVELMRLEQALGPDVVYAGDPRFGHQIQAIGLGCSDTSELLATLPVQLEERGRMHETRLRVVRDLCTQLEAARKLDLLAEIDAIVRSISRAAQAAITLRFFGWDGRGGATLQQVGDEYGLSRERVRQITTCTKERLEARGRVFAPAATRALEIARGLIPASVSSVRDALASAGLVPQSSDLQFLGDLGPMLGSDATLRFDSHKRYLVSTEAGEKLAAAVHEHALRLAGTYGVACVEDVCDAAQALLTSAVRPEGVSRLLRTMPQLFWLDDDRAWFCKRKLSGNLLLKRVHKVVAVAGRVQVSELRGGLSRDYSLKGSVPPKAILLRLCGYDPALQTDGETVANRKGVDLEGSLSPPERVLWRVFVDDGPVLERSRLERACVANGLSRPSFQATLTYSPIVIRYAPQVYGLRGIAVAPGIIEAAQPTRSSRQRLLLDSGWTHDGRVRLVYRLSEGCVTNGLVTVPSAFTTLLQGDFRLLRMRSCVGTFRCRGAQGWGLGPFFRRVGAEAGETLSLEFDLEKLEAVVSLAVEAPEHIISASDADRLPFSVSS